MDGGRERGDKERGGRERDGGGGEKEEVNEQDSFMSCCNNLTKRK